MNRVLFVVACASFTSSLFIHMTDPLVPLIAAEFAVDTRTAALVSTAFAVPWACMQPILGPLGDIVGKTRVIRVCLVLLTLIAYIAFFGPDGQRVVDAKVFADNTFIWAEAGRIAELVGPLARHAFMLMGVAILFTTEFGVLDAASRISTDVVKVAWLRENQFWSEGRLYYAFLWGEIVLACGILLLDEWHIKVGTMQYFKLAAAMNGGVMFLYAMALVVVNRWRLPAAVRIPGWRLAILVATATFFGFFTVWAGFDLVRALL